MEPAGPSFGQLLRDFRRSAAMSQEALAERAGLSSDTIRALERGRHKSPRAETFSLLADALALSSADRSKLIAAANSEERSVPEAPAIPTMPRPATRLGMPALGPLIGREYDEAAIQHLLNSEGRRLVTIVGPGGIGKTRLAVEVAGSTMTRSAFGDGTFFVDLSTVDAARQVPQLIARTIGLTESPGINPVEQIIARLGDDRVLLVLDNFEHVTAASPVVLQLVASCNSLSILATSRISLNVRGEQQYPLSPLTTPSESDTNLEEIRGFPAVRLFASRAQAIQPAFRVEGANAAAVAAICRRLDGLPLALELAATRISLLPPALLLQRLDKRQDLLGGGLTDLPDRQQTLRTTIDWSYQLLRPAEQRLLAGLGVFRGGAELDAIEAVCGVVVDGEQHVLDGLSTLARHSLIRRIDTPRSPRFSMLETISAYARERLEELESRRDVQARQAAYFTEFATKASQALHGPDQGGWLARLQREHENLVAALNWLASEEQCQSNGLLRLAGALWPFWEAHGYQDEGLRWLTLALASDGGGAPELRGEALRGAGLLATWQGDYDSAERWHRESLELYQVIDDPIGIANAWENLGLVAHERGSVPEAEACHLKSLEIRRRLDDTWGIAGSLNNLGTIATSRREYDAAWELLTESLNLLRLIGHDQGVGNVLTNLSSIAYRQARYDSAEQLLDESLAVRRRIGDQRGLAISFMRRGRVAIHRGDYGLARREMLASLGIAHKLGDTLVADCLESLAMLEVTSDAVQLAAQLLGAAGALRARVARPVSDEDRLEMDRWFRRSIERTGTDKWQMWLRRGSAMPMTDVVHRLLANSQLRAVEEHVTQTPNSPSNVSF